MTLIREKLDNLLADQRTAESMLKSENEHLIKSEQDLQCAAEAQQIIQYAAEVIQQLAHNKIAKVVSRCLEVVFDEPYEFKISFVRKRGKTEANLSFVRDGNEVDPLSASGGGVVDVASFALRLAALVLTKPPQRRLLVMDEPFRFLSQEYRGRVRELLEILSDEMDVQFVMVTHIEELRCGTVFDMRG